MARFVGILMLVAGAVISVRTFFSSDVDHSNFGHYFKVFLLGLGLFVAGIIVLRSVARSTAREQGLGPMVRNPANYDASGQYRSEYKKHPNPDCRRCNGQGTNWHVPGGRPCGCAR